MTLTAQMLRVAGYELIENYTPVNRDGIADQGEILRPENPELVPLELKGDRIYNPAERDIIYGYATSDVLARKLNENGWYNENVIGMNGLYTMQHTLNVKIFVAPTPPDRRAGFSTPDERTPTTTTWMAVTWRTENYRGTGETKTEHKFLASVWERGVPVEVEALAEEYRNLPGYAAKAFRDAALRYVARAEAGSLTLDDILAVESALLVVVPPKSAPKPPKADTATPTTITITGPVITKGADDRE